MPISRRDFLRTTGAGALAYTLARPGSSSAQAAGTRPNVLFIAVDDLNHWIEPLGGHPQAHTPNLTRLAGRSVNFRHACCASPSCLPARTALLTGKAPYNTGVYTNYQYWREALPDVVTLPQYFKANGYYVAGAGKIFHNNQPDTRAWDAYFPSLEHPMPGDPRPPGKGPVNMTPFPNMYTAFDWAPLDVTDDDMGDSKSVAWITEHLQREHDKPFFLGCGIYKPHLPWYVPRKYYDLFPLEEVELPEVLPQDLDDVPDRGRDIAHRGGDYHKHVVEAGQWKNAVQGYLASMAFSDATVGKLLDALEKSRHADNTIVVLWSDHGWQFGEKEHWRKFALWDNLVHVALMMRVPKGVSSRLAGGSADGVPCDRVISMLDLYPTLVELCGLPPRDDLDGRSLVPLLEDPARPWDHPAISTYAFNEFSIRTADWHYIHYIDDTEELYDLRADPREWTNLATDPDHAEVKERLAASMPRHPAAVKKTSYKLLPWHLPPPESKEAYEKLKGKWGAGG